MIRGSAWMMTWRWGFRAIGFISTIILARILTPSDFGLVAMAMLAVGLIELFSDVGLRLAIIRHPDPKRRQLDTAWTLSVCVGAAITVALWTIAPFAAQYFRTPEVEILVRVLACHAFIGAFENIGVALLRRNFEFRKEVQYRLIQKTTTVAVTLALAALLRNYWALVAGVVAGRAIEVALSFWVHPYRPRPSFAATRELWSFSFWVLLISLSEFVNGKSDEIAVGRFAGAASMGHYNVAADVASAPTYELVAPIGRALFPIYSRVAREPAELQRTYLLALSAVTVLCCAAGPGVALVARDLVLVLLSDQWIAAAKLMHWLAVATAVQGISDTAINMLNAQGRARLSSGLTWLRAGALLPAMIIAASFADVELVAMARLVVVTSMAPVVLWVGAVAIGVTPWRVVAQVWRPMVAAAVMSIMIMGKHGVLPIDSALARLVTDIALGGATFVCALILVWVISGRRDGIERECFERLRTLRRRSLTG